MVENIGSIIKGFSVFLLWLGLTASLISGVLLIFKATLVLIGFIVMAIGMLFSVLLFFAFMGLGQLVANTNILVCAIAKIGTPDQPKTVEEKLKMLHDWKEQGLITKEEYSYLILDDTF